MPPDGHHIRRQKPLGLWTRGPRLANAPVLVGQGRGAGQSRSRRPPIPRQTTTTVGHLARTPHYNSPTQPIQQCAVTPPSGHSRPRPPRGTAPWAHETPARLPPGVAALQRAGVLVSRSRHARHHRPPYNTSYSTVSGMWNGVLDRYKVFEAVEKVIYLATGVQPRSWGMKM
ncbi:unnamed protein product [Urochloa humidicola]